MNHDDFSTTSYEKKMVFLLRLWCVYGDCWAHELIIIIIIMNKIKLFWLSVVIRDIMWRDDESNVVNTLFIWHSELWCVDVPVHDDTRVRSHLIPRGNAILQLLTFHRHRNAITCANDKILPKIFSCNTEKCSIRTCQSIKISSSTNFSLSVSEWAFEISNESLASVKFAIWRNKKSIIVPNFFGGRKRISAPLCSSEKIITQIWMEKKNLLEHTVRD